MSGARTFGMMLLTLAITPAWTTARGDDSAAANVLKDKGLSKAGTTFVIPDEQNLLAKVKEFKGTLAGLNTLLDRQAMQEQFVVQLAQLEQQRLTLQNEIAQMTQSINQQGAATSGRGRMRSMPNPLVAERTQLNAALAEVTQTQKNMKPQAPTAKDKSAVDDLIKKKVDEIKVTLGELRPIVDDTLKKYADLKEDETVKKAMDDLKKETKANFKLGPSDAFQAAAKNVENNEKKFLGKRPAVATPKRKATAKK